MTSPSARPASTLETERLVRYAHLRPCFNAFVDSRTPGSERKENFTIIGPGVSENPDQYVHIAQPHGFNIGGARQPPRCVNSQHSHLTAEVFIVHSGRWAFRSGEGASDGEVIMERGDVVSLPPRMFRGFENVGDEIGFLFAVLGGDDPGHVLWAPYVFDAAESFGLILLENGSLVDTTLGQTIPSGERRMPKTSSADIAALDRYDSEALQKCVRKQGSTLPSAGSVLATRAVGVRETPILGPTSQTEGLGSGAMERSHGFALRQLDFSQGGAIPAHTRFEEEVLLMHRGVLRVTVDGESALIRTGDVLSVPIEARRSFENAHEGETTVHVVRRGDRPTAPVFD